MRERLFNDTSIDPVSVPRPLYRDRMAPRVTISQRCDECGSLLTNENPARGYGCTECEA